MPSAVSEPTYLQVLKDLATKVEQLAKDLDINGKIVWSVKRPKPNLQYVEIQFIEHTGEPNPKYNLFLRPRYFGTEIVRIEEAADSDNQVMMEVNPLAVLAYITF